jgi:hypothetical protein
MRSPTDSGKPRPGLRPSTIARISASASAASVTGVTWERDGHGGSNSRRAVTTTMRLVVGQRAITSPRTSSDEGSHQWRSSLKKTAGCSRASPSSQPDSASIVRRLCIVGLIPSRPTPSAMGIDRSAARSSRASSS